jgi:peptidoglycan/xylan/chitin deacetylase (PgdA/CDA1 family)
MLAEHERSKRRKRLESIAGDIPVTELRVAFNPAAVSRRLYSVDPAAHTRRASGAGREFRTRRSRIVLGLLARLPRSLSRPGGGRVVVLAYHAITDLSGEGVLAEYGVPPERFAAQVDALRRGGWSFVDLERVRTGLTGGGELPRRAILLTFDDGYADLLSEGAPLLSGRGVPAVAFAITERIGGNNDWDGPRRDNPQPLLDEEGLRSLAGAGVAIGSHGATHRRLTELDPAELEAEVKGSKAHLGSIGLADPVAFSYPYGAWSPEVAAAVKDAGYELAFTVRPGAADRSESPYALPRVEVFAADGPRAVRLQARSAAWPAWLRRPLLRLLGTKP